jgi:hypothetical protein
MISIAGRHKRAESVIGSCVVGAVSGLAKLGAEAHGYGQRVEEST